MGKDFAEENVINLEPDVRIRLHLFRKRGKGLVNFVYQLEINHEEKWKVVIRYDCFHEFFHKDIYSPSGRKRKVERIPDITNIKEALDLAVNDLNKNRDIYIRRFVGDKK